MTNRSRELNRKSKVCRTGDPIPWKYCFLTTVCGLILVAGFFYAARQHFASMEYSMENANLRKQIKELESENNRYKLEREIALSPAEIKKAAKKLGLRTMTANNIEVAKQKKEPKNQDQSKNSNTSVEAKKKSVKTETKNNVDSKNLTKGAKKEKKNQQPIEKNSVKKPQTQKNGK